MKYIDLHCDALTNGGVLQVTAKTLAQGGCLLQCFAAFLRGKENRFSRALALCDKFDGLCAREGYAKVEKLSDLREDKINAMLTVEEGGAIEGDLEKLDALYGRGVRMMTLTWNEPNEIGYPAFPDYAGLRAGRRALSERETERGLTDFGRQAVERMIALRMIPDVSHGSDMLLAEAAEICRERGAPLVASHSGAAAIYPCARNLLDGQIRQIARCGGVIGLDFCAEFLSDDSGAEAQRTALLLHARHILNVGGEDALAIGSDFDGIPENAYLKTPAYMPKFAEELEKQFGGRIADKILCKNARRTLAFL